LKFLRRIIATFRKFIIHFFIILIQSFNPLILFNSRFHIIAQDALPFIEFMFDTPHIFRLIPEELIILVSIHVLAIVHLAFFIATIREQVLTVTVWVAIFKPSYVVLTICKDPSTEAMKLVVFEFTFLNLISVNQPSKSLRNLLVITL